MKIFVSSAGLHLGVICITSISDKGNVAYFDAIVYKNTLNGHLMCYGKNTEYRKVVASLFGVSETSVRPAEFYDKTAKCCIFYAVIYTLGYLVCNFTFLSFGKMA